MLSTVLNYRYCTDTTKSTELKFLDTKWVICELELKRYCSIQQTEEYPQWNYLHKKREFLLS